MDVIFFFYFLLYMPLCKNDSTRSYKGTEPSPKGFGYCAHAEKVGVNRKGKDGNIWIVSKMEDKISKVMEQVISDVTSKNPQFYDECEKKFNSTLEDKSKTLVPFIYTCIVRPSLVKFNEKINGTS